MIRKKSWPWVGTTEHEMGSMSKSFQDTDQSPQNYDMLYPSKSINPEEYPHTRYYETFVSPVESKNIKPISLSDDKYLKDKKQERTENLMSSKKTDNQLKKILEGFLETPSKNKKNIKAIFDDKLIICDVAQTYQEKIDGLQTYPALNEENGLIFPYKKPEDVIYHMGTVSYPIDIIFLDEDSKVKKVYSNIQPGTLGTFGCSNVKYVLEVVGGLAKNLKQNDFIKLEPVKSEIKKSASLNLEKNKIIDIYCFDSLIEKNPYVYIDSLNEYNEENIKLSTDNKIYTPKETFKVNVENLDKFLGNRSRYNISKTSSAFKNFLENTEEVYEIYKMLKESFKNPNCLTIFATALDSPKQVSEAFISKLEILYGKFPTKNYLIQKISKDDNYLNIIEKNREFYSGKEIKLNISDDIFKRAGSPIPQSIKESSKLALKYLNDADDNLNISVDNLKKNLSEYEKIRNDQQKIESTQGQYHQSVKRNIEVAKKYLGGIRDAIRVLNKIKDATTTMEIIEALAQSSQSCSKMIQEIFDLVNKIKTPDFTMLLTENTNNYIKSVDDLKATINRAKDYINKEILGIIVLSS